jgi:hypothetical protein
MEGHSPPTRIDSTSQHKDRGCLPEWTYEMISLSFAHLGVILEMR